jgi:hypothetical protein
MTDSLHPLVTLFLILILIALAVLVWAVRSFEKRLAGVERRAAVRKGITAMPMVDTAEDVNGGFSIDEDLDFGRIVRAHIPPAPVSAVEHVSAARLDVTI